MSPDSVGYIASARHLVQGQGLLLYDSAPLVEQPPFYPIVLALVEWLLGFDALVAGRAVNALLHGLIVCLAGLLMARCLHDAPPFMVAGVLFVLLSAPLLEVAVMAWAEPLFILLALAFLLGLGSYLASHDRSLLLLISLAAALACLTRYIGVTLVLTGVAAILFLTNAKPSVKITHSLLFAIVSILPLLLWVIHNYVLTTTFFGPRTPSRFALGQNLDLTVRVLLSWFIPWQVSAPLPGLIVLGVLAVGIVTILAKNRWRTPEVAWCMLAPTGLFVISYLGFLIVSSTVIAFDKIDNRLVSPVYVPMVLLVLIWLRNLLDPLIARISATLAYGLLVIFFVCWLVHPLRTVTAGAMQRINEGAGGYNTRLWRASETIRYLQDQRWDGQTLYSNGPDVGYILAGLNMKWSPLRGSSNLTPADDSVLAQRESWPESPEAYLIWFDNIHRSYVYKVDELQAVADITPVIKLADGMIYIVSRK